ncbi:MAG: NAD(P)/FAD-dependent oxidoreductase [Rhodospirillaceae bacterium]
MPVSSYRTDVVIVGAGPVGLFAVFECGMLGMKCHVIDALEMAGGQCAALYPEKPIYDIPGSPALEAGTLIDRLCEQAAPFAPTFHFGEQVTRLSEDGDGRWLVETLGRTGAGSETLISARAVIIAAGNGAFGPNRPPLDGIEAYEGKSVHYLVRKRQDFTGLKVVIAGGGDSAVDWALALVDIAAHIMVIHRRPKFRAARESAARLDALVKEGRIELVAPYQLSGLEGHNGQLSGVRVVNLDGVERTLPADSMLAFFGLSMNLGPINEWGLELDHGLIRINQATGATNRPGLFAAGDIATYPGKLKLILTGFAEAAQAAHAIRPLIFPDDILHFEYSTTKGVP